MNAPLTVRLLLLISMVPVIRTRPSASIDNQTTEAGYVHGTGSVNPPLLGVMVRAPTALAFIVPLLTNVRLLIMPDPANDVVAVG